MSDEDFVPNVYLCIKGEEFNCYRIFDKKNNKSQKIEDTEANELKKEFDKAFQNYYAKKNNSIPLPMNIVNKGIFCVVDNFNNEEIALIVDGNGEISHNYIDEYKSFFDSISNYASYSRIIDFILFTILESIKISDYLHLISATDLLHGFFIQNCLQEGVGEICVGTTDRQKKFDSNEYFHELILSLSSAKYESGSNVGYIAIAKPDDKIKAKFVEPIVHKKKPADYQTHLKETSHIRKLLELTNEKFQLIYDGTSFIGIDDIVKYNNDYYMEISFKKNNTFIISENRKINETFRKIPYIKVKDGEISLPRLKLDKVEFKRRINKLKDDSINKKIVEVVEYISENTKGTTIIVTSKINAKAESKRLRDCCTLIESIDLINEFESGNKELLTRLTSIDGAIIIDTQGICYAIGVILDGTYLKGGNAGRGARFNSSNTYIKSKEPGEYLCITLSEDGHVNYFMNLGKNN